MAKAGFCPIIEPVRESLGGLQKALEEIEDADGEAIVIVNPYHGELVGGVDPLTRFLQGRGRRSGRLAAGILLKPDTDLATAQRHYSVCMEHSPVFIHAGFADARGLANVPNVLEPESRHIFVEAAAGKLYQKHFRSTKRILIRDGFLRKRNRDYELLESFSDLHATYRDEGMIGFGDFLTVGDDYRETGGPAYAVAIHLTFIDPDQDDTMQIYHFVSDRQDTPTDPAGKFAEALDRMMAVLDRQHSKVYPTDAISEFRHLHAKRHFPGLGYVKKLSMNHHIETMAKYLERA